MEKTANSSRTNFTIKESFQMLRGMIDSDYFKEKVRPMLYARADYDAESVHNLVIGILEKHRDSVGLDAMSKVFFQKSKKLFVNINGKSVFAIGTSAGMDKNGNALSAFGKFFGFEEPGTVIVPVRPGNDKPRVVALENEFGAANAQGFPSKGLEYFYHRISRYRDSKGKATIYVSICGLPLVTENSVDVSVSMKEMEKIIITLRPFVDGFVWNPYSPNSKALQLLRVPEIFRDTSILMKELAPNKLRLLKIGPYEAEQKKSAFDLINPFMGQGGDGIITTNTKMIQKSELPESIRNKWGYETAAKSGPSLGSYRLRSVKDMRMEYPNSIIIATGGISAGIGRRKYPGDVYESMGAGANLTSAYTSYTYLGLGQLRRLQKELLIALEANGWHDLQTMQDSVRNKAFVLNRDKDVLLGNGGDSSSIIID